MFTTSKSGVKLNENFERNPLCAQWIERNSAERVTRSVRPIDETDRYGFAVSQDEMLDQVEQRERNTVKKSRLEANTPAARQEADWIEMYFSKNAQDKARAEKKLSEAGYSL